MERFEQINQFWLGSVEATIIPTERRARIWFGEDRSIDETIRSEYYTDFCNVIDG